MTDRLPFSCQVCETQRLKALGKDVVTRKRAHDVSSCPRNQTTRGISLSVKKAADNSVRNKHAERKSPSVAEVVTTRSRNQKKRGRSSMAVESTASWRSAMADTPKFACQVCETQRLKALGKDFVILRRAHHRSCPRNQKRRGESLSVAKAKARITCKTEKGDTNNSDSKETLPLPKQNRRGAIVADNPAFSCEVCTAELLKSQGGIANVPKRAHHVKCPRSRANASENSIKEDTIGGLRKQLKEKDRLIKSLLAQLQTSQPQNSERQQKKEPPNEPRPVTMSSRKRKRRNLEDDGEKITIRVQDLAGTGLFFKVGLDTQICKVFHGWAVRNGADQADLRFIYERRIIERDRWTPRMLNMDDHSVIHAMSRQRRRRTRGGASYSYFPAAEALPISTSFLE
jgi:hypothetical protein